MSKYNDVINLSQNRLSTQICSLINCEELHGLSLSSRGDISSSSSWFRYLNDYESIRKQSVFNYIDVFKRAVLVNPNGYNKIYLKESVKGILLADGFIKANLIGKSIVSIQVLTSEEKKNWGAENFKELIESILLENENVACVLLGAPNEIDYLNNLKNLVKGPIADRLHIFAESLSATFTLLNHSQILITGDTSIKHMGAAVDNLPIIELSIGSSHLKKTGVYVKDAVILQAKRSCAPCGHDNTCENQQSLACRQDIAPKLVTKIANYILGGSPVKKIEKIFASENLLSTEVYLTEFTGYGLWFATSICGQQDIVNEKLNQWTWAHFLDNKIATRNYDFELPHEDLLMSDIARVNIRKNDLTSYFEYQKLIKYRKSFLRSMQGNDFSLFSQSITAILNLDSIANDAPLLELYYNQIVSSWKLGLAKNFYQIRKLSIVIDDLITRYESKMKIYQKVKAQHLFKGGHL
ncbi:MAG: hypothetical protein HOO06_09300 [Bdellovibrionaceae bacterium]|nr:hypothetical protein [Pseudobdellovibrionaceae bacterium]